jgi:1-acyl-sn-glycerol-3-phosphate acyltransferase
MFFYILVLLWILLGLYIARKTVYAYRVSHLSNQFMKEGKIDPTWYPFIRSDLNTLPSFPMIVLRAFFMGPIFMTSCLLAVVAAGICSLVLPAPWLVVATGLASRIICFCSGIRIRETGIRASTSHAPCIVANHNSAFDIIILLTKHYCFVSMEAVRTIPVVGTVAKALGCIFVARESKDSRSDAKAAIKERLSSQVSGTCKNQPPLVVFPEGSTNNGHYLLQFRRGAFEANVPIQPLFIEFQDHSLNFTIIRLSELTSLACCLPGREVTLHWLPIIQPGGSPEELAAKARDMIANCPSAYGHAPLIKADASSHREAISAAGFFRSIIS